MIVHRKTADTRMAFVWTAETGDVVEITAVEMKINDVVVPDVLTFEPGLVSLHLNDDYVITAGNHTYQIRANDGTDWTILSAGMLRVR